MVFLHVMRPVNQAGAQHSLSPMKADGGAVMIELDALYVRKST